jgi:hypothetical protein
MRLVKSALASANDFAKDVLTTAERFLLSARHPSFIVRRWHDAPSNVCLVHEDHFGPDGRT